MYIGKLCLTWKETARFSSKVAPTILHFYQQWMKFPIALTQTSNCHFHFLFLNFNHFNRCAEILLEMLCCVLSHVRLFSIPWSKVRQAPLAMESSRQEYWSGLAFPPPGVFLVQGSQLSLLHWQADSFLLCHWEAHFKYFLEHKKIAKFSYYCLTCLFHVSLISIFIYFLLKTNMTCLDLQSNLLLLAIISLGASLVAQTIKNPPTMKETWVQSLGQEDPLEKGVATHSTIPAWEIPWTDVLRTANGVTKSRTWLSD